MKKWIRFIEQAGFSTINTDDKENVEILDLNNNQLKKSKNGYYIPFIFKGTDDQAISTDFSSWVDIKFNDYFRIHANDMKNEQLENWVNKIYIYDDEKLRNSFRLEFNTSSFEGNEINEAQGFINVKVISIGYNNEYDQICGELNVIHYPNGVEVFLKDSKFSEYEISNLDMNQCTPELMLEYILDFISNVRFISLSDNVQTGLNMIVPTLKENLDEFYRVILGNSINK